MEKMCDKAIFWIDLSKRKIWCRLFLGTYASELWKTNEKNYNLINQKSQVVLVTLSSQLHYDVIFSRMSTQDCDVYYHMFWYFQIIPQHSYITEETRKAREVFTNCIKVLEEKQYRLGDKRNITHTYMYLYVS